MPKSICEIAGKSLTHGNPKFYCRALSPENPNAYEKIEEKNEVESECIAGQKFRHSAG
jgi:hypothetical protein